MDNGKQQALFEFCFLAAKEGGYEKEYVKDFDQLPKKYFIPMISALVNEKLVSEENEFDEALFVLEQYSPRVVKAQLRVEDAKNGDKTEIMKFIAALVYEFRVQCPAVFTRLCKSMSGENQHNIAHFISYMDNATTDEDINWWQILFIPYSSEGLKELGAVKTATSIQTPHKTPMRSFISDKSVFDNPVDIVINSPSGKDRLIQEYERRLKSERQLVQTLQNHCEETFEENTRLKMENGSLKEKLKMSNKTVPSFGCGEECQSKNELAAMKLLITVRENKVQQLAASLNTAQQDLEIANETVDKQRLENRQMKERVEFLSNEIERFHNVSNELNETRQKLSKAIKEKEDLWIKGSLNTDLSAKTQQLSTENEQLRAQNEELIGRLASMEELVNELRATLAVKNESTTELSDKLLAKNKTLIELTNKLDMIEKVKKESVDEQSTNESIQAIENKKLKQEVERLRASIASNKRRADEAEKRCSLLEEQYKKELKNVKRMEVRAAVKPPTAFFVSTSKLDPAPEPVDLANKSLATNASTFPVPTSVGASINGRRTPFQPKFKTPSGSAPGFEYDNTGRLKILQERNRKVLPHLRSHHAVELESGFSPSQTMNFEKLEK